MPSFNQYIPEYKKQISAGAIQAAYKGLMEYLLDLRTYFKNHYPDYFVSGSLYSGYMDMSYFSVIPESLKKRSLKIAIVFIHATCRFEAWLAGYNKQVQRDYWKFIKKNGWNQYHLVPTTRGADAILDHVLVEDPDFNDLVTLTKQIEAGTLKFIQDVETFLSTHLQVME